MAVTKIWDIHGRVDKVLKYAVNLQKTENIDYEELSQLHCIEDVLEYTADEMKTEQKYFVTGVNCEPDFAAVQFMNSKNRWKKTGGIVAYHAYQSFSENEVDATTAHEIGVALAKELWGDRFEVVVATHCNTGHFHNHFVLNSVSYIDGKRYYDKNKTYRRMREVSDRLCEERGLSVIYDPQSGRIPYNVWKDEKEGRTTKFDTYRRDIDGAVKGSVTIKQFLRNMNELGYEVVTTGKYPRFREFGREKFHRLYKLGEDYTLDAITDRILENYREDNPFENSDDERPDYEPLKKEQYHKNIYLLYVHYSVELKFYQTHPYSLKRVHPALREDAKNLERIAKQTVFLGRTGIKTMAELQSYRDKVSSEITELYEHRDDLRNQLKKDKRADNEVAVDKTKTEISALSFSMKEMRKEINLCDRIAERSGDMGDCIEYITNERNIEKRRSTQDEHIRGSSRTDRENESKWRGSSS